MELWLSTRRTRLTVIFGLCVVCFFFLFANGIHTYALHRTQGTSFLSTWVQFGTSTCIALLFLAVGGLVWLYARTRAVASLLLVFSFFMAVTFAVQTSAADSESLFSTIGQASASLSLPLLFLLLLLFPKNHLDQHKGRPVPKGRHVKRALLWGYIAVTSVLSVLVAVFAALRTASLLPQWGGVVVLLYYLFILVGILSIIVSSYRMASTPQEQQQLRLFVGGIVLAFTPFLLLTVLPLLLGLPAPYVISGQISTLTFCLFPASMGYSILRFQLLVLDTYVRRIIGAIVRIIGLAFLCYVTLALSSLFFSASSSISVACVAGTITLLAPPVWIGAKTLSDAIFFPDAAHYHHLLEQPVSLNMEKLTLDNAAELLTLAAINTFETPQACVLVLDAEGTSYQACPPLSNTTGDETRVLLLHKVAHVLMNGDSSVERQRLSSPLLERLTTTERPLLLSELQAREKEALGFAQYLGGGPSDDGGKILCAPIRIQGAMIAVLLLGERAHQRQYAGPDFGIVQLLLERFSSLVETTYLTRELQATNTQLRTKNLQLTEAYERQKELDRLKDDLMINVSHELRTPLTEVSGYLDLLSSFEGTVEPAMQTLFLQKATHGCQELQVLVTTILDAAQSSKVSAPPQLEEVSIAEVVREELDNLDPQAVEEHSFECSCADDLLVQANAQHVRQVLRNLLSNALKYSPAGASITVRMEEGEDTLGGHPRVTLRIKDRGLGIPPAEIPLLFGRFVRLQRDLSGSIRGTGMGLYISKQLVESMGGTIWVESTGIPGEGSCFCFTLRRAFKQHSRSLGTHPGGTTAQREFLTSRTLP